MISRVSQLIVFGAKFLDLQLISVVVSVKLVAPIPRIVPAPPSSFSRRPGLIFSLPPSLPPPHSPSQLRCWG